MVAPNDFNACNPNIYPSSAGVGFHSDRRSLVGAGERRDVIRTLSVVMSSSLLSFSFLLSLRLSGDLDFLLSFVGAVQNPEVGGVRARDGRDQDHGEVASSGHHDARDPDLRDGLAAG